MKVMNIKNLDNENNNMKIKIENYDKIFPSINENNSEFNIKKN